MYVYKTEWLLVYLNIIGISCHLLSNIGKLIYYGRSRVLEIQNSSLVKLAPALNLHYNAVEF